jgi:hypothetical protein
LCQRLLFYPPLNAELNPICHLLALLRGATIVDVSRLRVKQTGEFEGPCAPTVCRCVQMLTTYEMTQHKNYTVIPRYPSNRFTTFSPTRDSQINSFSVICEPTFTWTPSSRNQSFSPMSLLGCHRFPNRFECAGRHDIPQRSAQQQQQHATGRLRSHTFAVNFALFRICNTYYFPTTMVTRTRLNVTLYNARSVFVSAPLFS